MTASILGASSTVVPILDVQKATLDSDQGIIAEAHDISLDETVVKTTTRAASTASPKIPVAQTTTLQPALTEVVHIMTREEVRRELLALEQKYGMTSEAFYNLWQAGKSPIEGVDKLRWAAFWEAWQAHYLLGTKP
jgi:hypothetical protein